MSFPVSIIPYANMGPFLEPDEPAGCEFIQNTPRQSTRALARGKVLAAPLPVGDYLAIQDQVEFLGPFGIAAKGAVKSVLLFSDRPFAEMAAPAKLYLTDHSSSSIRLLFLLMLDQLGLDRLPYKTSRKENANAYLLIGDDALDHAAENKNRFVTDLAEKWWELNQLPFVFARWVIRKDAPISCRQALDRWLKRFQEEEPRWIHAAAKTQAKRLGVDKDSMLAYLKGMRRVLGPDDMAGQDLFVRRLQSKERSPLFLSAPEENK
jgi:chorismate dehydratase